MKKNAIMSLLVALSVIGCSKLKVGNTFLEKPPSVDVTIDTMFSSLKDANRVLNAAYKTLPYGILYSLSSYNLQAEILFSLTDLAQSYRQDGSPIQYYYSGQYNAGTEENRMSTKFSYLYQGTWDGIRVAYIFMNNIDRVPNVGEATKKQMIAEAKMIIALHYTDMYRNYGGVPWIGHAVKPNEGIKDYPRLTSMEMVDSIVTLINSAIPDLPWTLQNVTTQDGHFTQAGAMGLKARLLLFAASPLFNSDKPYLDGEASQNGYTWDKGYHPDLWKKAADAAHALIEKIKTNGGYGLVNTGNPRDDFKKAYYDRGNGEILISTRKMYKPDNDYNYLVFDLMRGHGVALPAQEYVDMFPMANGESISDPNSGYDADDPYKDRDPRLYETVLVNGDRYQGRTAQLWIGGLDRRTTSQWSASTGYDVRKFLLDFDNAARGSIIQWPYLRLPEIYLSYAEATNEVNNGPTPEAYDYVNIVRNRVGLGDLPQNLDKVEFRKAVLKERACEFGYERVRWFDLIRWKMADAFKKRLHGMNIHKNGSGFTYEKVELPERYWQKNWSPKWYLSAFPPSEVNKGYGLIQNPGW